MTAQEPIDKQASPQEGEEAVEAQAKDEKLEAIEKTPIVKAQEDKKELSLEERVNALSAQLEKQEETQALTKDQSVFDSFNKEHGMDFTAESIQHYVSKNDWEEWRSGEVDLESLLVIASTHRAGVAYTETLPKTKPSANTSTDATKDEEANKSEKSIFDIL